MLNVRSLLLHALMAGACMWFAGDAAAQCRSFAKNKCVPGIAPYKFNETFNAAQLSPGEEAEVNLTFFSGQDYRVMVCAHPILGNVDWKLVDGNGAVVFESKAADPKEHFDLRTQSTQQLKVLVRVPPTQGRSDMVHMGCVAILVGFKE